MAVKRVSVYDQLLQGRDGYSRAILKRKSFMSSQLSEQQNHWLQNQPEEVEASHFNQVYS